MNREHIKDIFRSKTSILRVLPDFIIIGAQRSGTTTLFRNLIKHPEIFHPIKKEIHYFDFYFNNGLNWYKKHFPIIIKKLFYEVIQKDFITGEATPYYLYHSDVPERVLNTIPDVKIIVLLRNPVDRAYSHYWQEVRKGYEKLSFEEALEKENERLALNSDIISLKNEFNYRHYSYFSRGIYIDQLLNWSKYFSFDRFLIIQSENFFKEPQFVFNKVFRFLNLPDYTLQKISKYHISNYPELNETTRMKLRGKYKFYNKKLFNYLGIDFDW